MRTAAYAAAAFLLSAVLIGVISGAAIFVIEEIR